MPVKRTQFRGIDEIFKDISHTYQYHQIVWIVCTYVCVCLCVRHDKICKRHENANFPE